MTFCAFVSDITPRRDMLAELRHADEQMRTSEQRLVAAQEMTGVGSWEWDIDSGAVTWSEQLYRNFGVDPECYEPSFDAYIGLCHPDDRQFVLETVTRLLNECGTFEIEHRSISPSDDEVRIHHCTGRVIVDGGRAVRMAGTLQDVTESRRAAQAVAEALEREKKMVVRLTELDEAKTRFVSSVSHELRTPLTSILGYLQFLQEAASELASDHRDMLNVIDRNSHRLLSLIEDLLTQSRIESGTFKLACHPTDIGRVVDNVCTAMHPEAKDRRLTLDACIDPDVGLVIGDDEQLERLLLNLVSNSLKFTPEGSVDVSAHREGDEVVLTVMDTGVGIPMDEVPNLFRPFFRSSNADNIAPGTGLGLAIVKAIVDEHRGTIDVSSETRSRDDDHRPAAGGLAQLEDRHEGAEAPDPGGDQEPHHPPDRPIRFGVHLRPQLRELLPHACEPLIHLTHDRAEIGLRRKVLRGRHDFGHQTSRVLSDRRLERFVELHMGQRHHPTSWSGGSALGREPESSPWHRRRARGSTRRGSDRRLRSRAACGRPRRTTASGRRGARRARRSRR